MPGLHAAWRTPWTVILLVFATSALATTSLIPPAAASLLEFTSDGTVLRDGAPLASDRWQINGTQFFFRDADDGVAQYVFQGDLNLSSSDEVRATGDRPISFFVGGDVIVADGALIDASASSTRPGPGGGLGGDGGASGEGGFRGGQLYTFPPSGPFDPPEYKFLGGQAGQGGRTTTGIHASFENRILSDGSDGERGGDGLAGGRGQGGFAGHAGSLGFNSAGTPSIGGSGGPGGLVDSAIAAGGSGGQHGTIRYGGNIFFHHPQRTEQNTGVGWPGGDGADGLTGSSGDTGSGAAHEAMPGTLALVGGNGGAGGGGGGGGAGGSSGAGGGGGGGSASSDAQDNVPGGASGDGGFGGAGGLGGSGGIGGQGGNGGGAFELRALGRIAVHGAIFARGFDGQPGFVGDAGERGRAGSGGELGVIINNLDFPTAADDGGIGGDGGDGGRGGRGGHGGQGGGGAGGTIKIVATHVVDFSTAAYDAAGGGSGATQGQDGRLVVGTTIGLGPDPNHAAAKAITVFTPLFIADNPFATTRAIEKTPLLIDLVGGPEAFGLSETITARGAGDAGVQQAIDAARHAGNIAMLVKLDNTGWLTAEDYAGYNAVALINLSGASLESPRLGGLTVSDPAALATGGWAHDPLFGDGADQVLQALEPGAAFVTLVPERTVSAASAEFEWHGQLFGGSWSEPAGQPARYLAIGQTPEPASMLLLALGALALWACRAGR
jgi:hypothetical protein